MPELDAEDDLQPRPWIPSDNIRDDGRYYSASPQERALRNLWIAVGTLAEALEGNQKQFRLTFLRAFEDAKQLRKSDSTYWFTSLRAHFLCTVFPEYLQHIQHAHQKLVQLLENMPGSLPGPTLLRRWSSGGYGELLSEYSRHVNWRTQDLYWDCCVEDHVERNEDHFEDWKSNQYLVHTWAHVHTSQIAVRRIGKSPGNGKPGPTVASVWSSYFYLEQPVLFPLLYHECAHQYVEKVLHGNPGNKRANPTRHGYQLWFDRADETAALLKRVATFQPNDQSLWRSLVAEVWIDAISISLCGPGYVFALALQLLGLDGNQKAFSDYFTDVDTKIPWDDIGKPDRRIYQVQYAEPEAGYLWEARLRLAVKVLDHIHPDWTVEKNQNSSLDLLELISFWTESGSEAMSERLTSREHSDWWGYRTRLNEWVHDVVWGQILDFADHLKVKARNKYSASEYLLDSSITAAINHAGKSYAARLFANEKSTSDILSLGQKLTIDDLCGTIRWNLSKDIIRLSDAMPTNSWAEKWATSYADYMRNDGSAAFRLGVEYTGAVKDVVRTASWILRKKGEILEKGNSKEKEVQELIDSLPTHELEFVMCLRNAVESDASIHHAGQDLSKLAAQLAMKPTLADEAERRAWPELCELLDRFKDRLIRQLTRCIADSRLDVGTFTLGVLRTGYIGHNKENNDTGAYSRGFQQLYSHYCKIRETRQSKLKDLYSAEVDELQFYPVFGEYNFAVFENDYTPVEKDIVTSEILPCLLKSRAVIRVCRASTPPKPSSFLRVSQIDFQYRWQWILLAERLPDSMEMYISSAWEDVILVSHHSSFEEFRKTTNELGIGLRPWMDIHSSMGINAINEKAARGKARSVLHDKDTKLCGGYEFVTRMHNMIKDKGLGEVRETTGRYDVDVVWNCNSASDFLSILDKLPSRFWHGASSVVSSFTFPVGPTNEVNSGVRIESRIMQRHDI